MKKLFILLLIGAQLYGSSYNLSDDGLYESLHHESLIAQPLSPYRFGEKEPVGENIPLIPVDLPLIAYERLEPFETDMLKRLFAKARIMVRDPNTGRYTSKVDTSKLTRRELSIYNNLKQKLR